jgi:hypothetical protein
LQGKVSVAVKGLGMADGDSKLAVLNGSSLHSAQVDCVTAAVTCSVCRRVLAAQFDAGGVHSAAVRHTCFEALTGVGRGSQWVGMHKFGGLQAHTLPALLLSDATETHTMIGDCWGTAANTVGSAW